MMIQKKIDIERLIETNSGIDAGYQHKSKRVASSEPFMTADVLLKWYAVYPKNHSVPDEITRLAHDYLLKNSLEAQGMGFVVLHRCGEDFYFLIVCTWRNSNELWETVFYKNGDAMTDFALFPRDGVHKPTLCVWELVPVWHEQKAWSRFLNSPRDGEAGRAWLSDCYAGLA